MLNLRTLFPSLEVVVLVQPRATCLAEAVPWRGSARSSVWHSQPPSYLPKKSGCWRPRTKAWNFLEHSPGRMPRWCWSWPSQTEPCRHSLALHYSLIKTGREWENGSKKILLGRSNRIMASTCSKLRLITFEIHYNTRIILCMHPANERQCSSVTPSLIG